jgi:hypothetical protein
MMKEVHARPDQKAQRSAALKASWASYTPEEREARIQGLRDTFTPERRLRVSAASKETQAKPEVKAKQRANLKKALSTPEAKVAKSERMRKIHARPGDKERRGAAISAAHNTPEGKAKLAARRRAGESLEVWKQRIAMGVSIPAVVTA